MAGDTIPFIIIPLGEPGSVTLPEGIGDRILVPLDLDAAEAASRQGQATVIPAIVGQLDRHEAVWETTVKILTAAMTEAALFPDCRSPVNPLFVPLHYLVTLLGGVAVRVHELAAIEAEFASRPIVLVQTALHVVGNAQPHTDYWQVAREAMPERFTLLAAAEAPRLVPRTKGSLRRLAANLHATLRYRVPAMLSRKPRLLVTTKQKAFCDGLIAANRDAGAPFAILRRPPAWRLACRNRKWQERLEAILPELAERVRMATNCPVAPAPFRRAVDAVYRQWRGEILDAVGAGCRGFADILPDPATQSSPGVAVEPLDIHPANRARQYNLYLRGYRIAIQEWSDGAGSGESDSRIYDYLAAPVATLRLYDGPAGVTQNAVFTARTGLVRKLALVGAVQPWTAARRHGATRARPRIVFLPGAAHGYLRYGPNFPHHDLAEWHGHLLQVGALTRIPGVDVLYKRHPKDRVEMGKLPLRPWQIEQLERLGATVSSAPLAEVLPEADVVVSDLFGSGFMDCLTAGVPCVYVDFGFIRHLPKCAELFSRGCVVIEASYQDTAWTDRLTVGVEGLLDGTVVRDHRPMLSYMLGDGDGSECTMNAFAAIQGLVNR